MFKKILVANRGEVAVRVIQACHELGIKTVAVYSEADKDALHVKLAGEAICIGAPNSNSSYLNISNLITAAKMTKSDAIHPGYGFLSENPFFAEMCLNSDLVFIGPSPKSIRVMGAKARAREVMQQAGVPVVPGSTGILTDSSKAANCAAKMGYPVIVKASAGGGGKGMRIVQNEDGLDQAIKMAQREAEAAFADNSVYLEKYLEEPRHIEIQILADQHGNIIHLGERDCSLQRRHQKILEEAPAYGLSTEIRNEMAKAAIAAARSVGYFGLGTVEFLLDRNANFYFMEMNTRLQVEHPITEMITGVDLVKEQIKIARNLPLSIRQEEVSFRGAAIECRINAEDAKNGFKPNPGVITKLYVPGGFGVRFDSHIYEGYKIPPYYDSLIGKMIVWGVSREEAIKKMKRVLSELIIEGVETTARFHLQVLDNAFYQKGDIYTNFIQRRVLGA
ncbi:MAG: acetyl-CoA carboxylase biotin carboxylase subunit [Bacillota bacterium]